MGGVGDSTMSPEPSGGIDHTRPSSLSAAQADSTVGIALKPDELQESVSVDIAEPGRPLQTISSAVKIDITPLVDVAIRASDNSETGDRDAQLKVSERDPSGLEAGNAEQVVSVNMNIVATKVRSFVCGCHCLRCCHALVVAVHELHPHFNRTHRIVLVAVGGSTFSMQAHNSACDGMPDESPVKIMPRSSPEHLSSEKIDGLYARELSIW